MSGLPRLDDSFASYKRLTIVALPLVLSQVSNMVMQFTDRLVLARYADTDALAAIGQAFFVFYSLISVFLGITMYTATFVAHYIGANRPDRVGPTIWQGFYLAIAGSLPVMLAPLFIRPLFEWFEHAPGMIDAEMVYLTVHCLGAPLFLLVTAVTGFFSGRNDNTRLMVAQFIGVFANLVFCLVLVPGVPNLGIPEMGIKGAAIATIIGQVVILACLLGMFFQKTAQEQFNTWTGRKLDLVLTKRIFKFGLPSGMRFACDLVVWTSFFLFLGGLGLVESAASNIVFGLNMIAFHPLLGVMMAVSVLVGQAQGAMRSDLAEKVGWRGLWLGQSWMIAWALLFVLFPDWLLSWFHSDTSKMSADDFAQVATMATVLLRFVAIYCIVDGVNIIVLGALQGAGDTKWTFWASLIIHAFFFAALLWLKEIHAGLYTLWAVATGFVFILALTWLVRFKMGVWKKIQVIEQDLEKA